MNTRNGSWVTAKIAGIECTIVEYFEWLDREALTAAHRHPDVLSMWARFESCCSYGTLSDLPHARSPFPEFELVGLY